MEIGIVIKSFSNNFITKEKVAEYDICFSPFRMGKSITKEEAMQYIKEHDLVKVVDCENGAIWDTRDKQFQKKFKGCFRNIPGNKCSAFRKFWL